MAFERVSAEVLYTLALKDTARNYFICYSIDNHQAYAAVWQLMDGEKPIIGVFLRKTGIIQIAYEPGLVIENYKKAIESLLNRINWKKAIVTVQVKKLFQSMAIETRVDEGAIIVACSPQQYKPSGKKGQIEIRSLTIDDLDDVIEIYLEVFKGFASYDYMVQKLTSGRGRAVGGYLDGKLVTVSQSDYELSDTAIIVGVATRIDNQGKGYGRACFEYLCKQLIEMDNKTLYLQYDAPIAGAFYKSLGFEMVDQTFHIEKIEEVNR